MNNTKNGIVALLSLTIFSILALVIFILARCSEAINPIPVLTETSTVTTVSTTLETETTKSNTTISTTVLTTTETVSSSSNLISSESSTITETVTLFSTEPVTTKDEIISIPYDIVVITDPVTDIKIVETTVCTTVIPYITTPTITEIPISSKRKLIKVFPSGTYFCYGRTGVKGGSGRTLIDCSIGENNGDKVIKGSIACRYLYDLYCYNKNKRTTVYIEVPEFPQMEGYYYLDDCNGDYNIVDFFYYYASNCPFQYQGVVSNVSVYVDN